MDHICIADLGGDPADLGGGHGGVIGRAKPERVQRQRALTRSRSMSGRVTYKASQSAPIVPSGSLICASSSQGEGGGGLTLPSRGRGRPLDAESGDNDEESPSQWDSGRLHIRDLRACGTSTDSGGGVVAGVEVSINGGVTWHPVTTMSAAATTVSWSYTAAAQGAGSVNIEVRATDDRGNIETPQSQRATGGGPS
jgi:hypothetical protein